MGPQERKQREREARRSAIINTAMKIFLKKGLANTTMEEIAEKAEYSKAVLYLYFKNVDTSASPSTTIRDCRINTRMPFMDVLPGLIIVERSSNWEMP